MSWQWVIGLEVHVQLNTASKIFSTSANVFSMDANRHANLVDLAMPGTLPVVNEAAIYKAIGLGLALGSKINRLIAFDRKNYFYPDLPKAYQITQLYRPIIEGGELEINLEGKNKKIAITRAHLEENAGKSIHDLFAHETALDFNRAGTPLIEVISEPVLHSSAEAVAYAKALHDLVMWLGICEGDMSRGLFRADVNVSVKREDSTLLGTRCEIKNLNSFRSIGEAIDYEANRQIEVLEAGGSILQETRLFDPDLGETRAMRSKEEAHDYRYFPDPDLSFIAISEQTIDHIQAHMPELPQSLRRRFSEQYGLTEEEAFEISTSWNQAQFFEQVAKKTGEGKQAFNWLVGDIAARLKREEKDFADLSLSPTQLSDLISRIQQGVLSSKLAKKVLAALWNSEDTVDQIIDREGYRQMTDSSAMEKMVEEVIQLHFKSVQEYQAGKEKALNALVGQVMKLSRGKANPQEIQAILKQKLKN